MAFWDKFKAGFDIGVSSSSKNQVYKKSAKFEKKYAKQQRKAEKQKAKMK